MEPNANDKWHEWSTADYAAAELHERERRRMAGFEDNDLHRAAEGHDPYFTLADRLGEANALVNDAMGLAASISAGMLAKRRNHGRRAALSRDLVKFRRMLETVRTMCDAGKSDALEWAARYTIAMPPGSGPGFARLFDEVESFAEEARRDLRYAFAVWEPAADEVSLGDMLV